MRYHPLAVGVLFLLAACGDGDTAANAVSVTANEVDIANAVSEPPVENATPDAGRDAESEAAMAALIGGDQYACENGSRVIAAYDQGADAFHVSVAGKSFTLSPSAAASGGKYTSEKGMSPGKSLTWWTKGDDAMLIQSPAGDRSGDKDHVINCRKAA